MKLSLGRSSRSWRDYDFLAIDVETTGLDLVNDQVISIGAVPIHDGRFRGVGNFYQQVSPTRSPSASSIVVHGIRSGDLQAAQPAAEVFPHLIALMQERLIIAHAAWVEKAFLSHRLKSYGYAYPRRVVDTAALARNLGLVDLDSGYEPSLELLAKELNLPIYSPHHALGDAMTTAGLFLALVAKIERREREKGVDHLTLKKLLELSRQSQAANRS